VVNLPQYISIDSGEAYGSRSTPSRACNKRAKCAMPSRALVWQTIFLHKSRMSVILT
jgi:hypothetical protein